MNTDRFGVVGRVADDWVLPKLMSLPIFGSIDRKELSSFMDRPEPLGRRTEPPLTLLLDPSAVRISRLVRLVLGGGFALRGRLTDLERVTGVRLVERGRRDVPVAGGRLPERCWTVVRRAALDERSRICGLV
jgi:hypothetical protein